MFDPKVFILTEWDYFKKSDTLKMVIAAETLAVAAFINEVMDGTVHLNRDSLKFWVGTQIAAIVVLLVRKTLAGLEAKADGKIDPEIIKALEKKAEAKAVSVIAEKHPEAAALLKTEFNKPPLNDPIIK